MGAALLAAAQNDHKHLRDGDKAYQNGNFTDAEVSYRRALEKKKSDQGSYNLGNATYRQSHYDEAVRHYEAAANGASEPAVKAQAFHNLGNALYQKGKYKESIEAYKNALRLNPKDADTKKNLANALRRLPPPPPPQPQNQQGQGQDKKNQDPQQNQPPSQGGQEPQDEQPQQPQQGEQPSGGGGEQQDLSKEEAQQLLDIMEGEDQKVQQKLRKAQSKNKKSPKDW